MRALDTTLDDLLAAAGARIRRYEPAEVPREAVVVDIRSADARARAGVVPGALHIPRTVLEWRVAPGSAWRTPHLAGTEQLVLLCDHGYSSILAAATLVELGLDAGDVVGGFEAWAGAGRPVQPAPSESWTGLPGTGPPD
jgi:rhodanese-related sulfurtransferase